MGMRAWWPTLNNCGVQEEAGFSTSFELWVVGLSFVVAADV
jgi:hypothetical protein